jgi:hypothetical protein
MRKTILATASALAISIVPALAAGGEMPGAPARNASLAKRRSRLLQLAALFYASSFSRRALLPPLGKESD